MDNLYSSLMGSFTNVLDALGTQLTKGMADYLKIGKVFPSIVTLLIVIWLIQKIKEKDLLEIKTIVKLGFSIAYIAISAWALNNPTDFRKYFNYIKVPAEIVNGGITNAIENTAQMKDIQVSKKDGRSGIDAIVNAEFRIIDYMGRIVWENFNILSLQKTILQVIAGTGAMIIQAIYICLICLIILMVTIQYSIWSSLAIFFLGLGFFKETRGIVYAYIKILISLTLYQPFLLMMASMNLASIDGMIKILPTETELKNASGITSLLTNTMQGIGVMATYLLICVVGILCIILTRQLPKIIDSILGTQSDISGVGNATSMVSKIATVGTSMATGGMIGAMVGGAKQAYAQKGGGIKGLANVGLAALTSGGSLGAKAGKDLVKKGISFGNSKIKGGKK